MSDIIPFPSADPVNLEVLRAFHDDYVQLQNVEEKKVILRMKDVLLTAIIRACADDMPTLDPRELDWGVLNKYKKPAPSGLTPPRPGNGGPRVGRNDTCPCGSGKKFKQCCGKA